MILNTNINRVLWAITSIIILVGFKVSFFDGSFFNYLGYVFIFSSAPLFFNILYFSFLNRSRFIEYISLFAYICNVVGICWLIGDSILNSLVASSVNTEELRSVIAIVLFFGYIEFSVIGFLLGVVFYVLVNWVKGLTVLFNK